MKAIWNNQVIAESDNTVVIENNHYFPPESNKKNILNQVTCRVLALGKDKHHISILK